MYTLSYIIILHHSCIEYKIIYMYVHPGRPYTYIMLGSDGMCHAASLHHRFSNGLMPVSCQNPTAKDLLEFDGMCLVAPYQLLELDGLRIANQQLSTRVLGFDRLWMVSSKNAEGVRVNEMSNAELPTFASCNRGDSAQQSGRNLELHST